MIYIYDSQTNVVTNEYGTVISGNHMRNQEGDKAMKNTTRIRVDGKGKRYNNSKTPYSQIPPAFIAELANHCGMGQAKYPNEDGQPNWTRGLMWQDVMDCAERHIAAWKSGESMDTDLQDSHHLIAAVWNLMVLHFMDSHQTQYAEFDNRSWVNIPVPNKFDPSSVELRDYGLPKVANEKEVDNGSN